MGANAAVWNSTSPPRILRYGEWARRRALDRLMANGVSPRRLRRALWRLACWLPQAELSWEQLAPQADGQHILFCLPARGLIDANGQRVFEFDSQCAAPEVFPIHSQLNGDSLFTTAVEFELQDDWINAERIYRRLLLEEGPDADVCFNLANVLVALGNWAGALERLWQAVELSPQFSEAWHNLGIVALELGQVELSKSAFARRGLFI